MSQIQSIRGMGDILPPDSAAWQALESILRELLISYGYQEIRVPLVERTELFKRSIGEVTDIVEKEMYTFEDRNGNSLTLRPEITAGIVRASITHGLLHNQRQKLWSTGPVFRYEKPQKGRYRQFYQFDVEALGFAGPDVDAELIIITDRRSRLHRNPMRILDSKNPAMKNIIAGAPLITDYLDAESEQHFAVLCRLLDQADIAYRLNPRLVRGLDYYTRTVFEWVTDQLGSQGAVCSGGRYDGLVEQLGGKATPAIGWAFGVERLLDLYRISGGTAHGADRDIYVVAVGDGVLEPAFTLVERLRDSLPALKIEMNCGGGSFKSQMKRADRSGAGVALILGEEEIASKTAAIKPLREKAEQISVEWSEIGTALAQYFDTSG